MSSNNEYKMLKEKRLREIENILQEYLPKQKGRQKIIMEAMERNFMKKIWQATGIFLAR